MIGKKVFSCLLLLISFTFIVKGTDELELKKILEKINKIINMPESICQMDLESYSKENKKGSFTFKLLKKDDLRFRVEFTAPAWEKGRKMLRIGDKIWMFLPNLGKSILISARQSFIGSSFSNADLLRTNLVSDYKPVSITESDGHQILEAIAISNKTTYNKVLIHFNPSNFYPIKSEFFTSSNKKLKTIRFDDFETNKNITYPHKITVVDDLFKDLYSVITITNVEVQKNLPEALFQKDTLDRM